LRAILEDAEFDGMLGGNEEKLSLFILALSRWSCARANSTSDFQFQCQIDANAIFDGDCSFVGVPL